MTDDKRLHETGTIERRRGLSSRLPQKMVATMFWALTGEWLVKHKNSGPTIALRAAFVSGLVFVAVWAMSLLPGLVGFVKALPWLGAVAAGVYTALYTRFASQWSYLAGVYNQIMQTESSAKFERCSPQHRALVTWKVGFIVDAWYVHLARKEPFLSVIRHWLKDDDVRTCYVRWNGEKDLNDLEAALQEPEAAE